MLTTAAGMSRVEPQFVRRDRGPVWSACWLPQSHFISATDRAAQHLPFPLSQKCLQLACRTAGSCTTKCARQPACSSRALSRTGAGAGRLTCVVLCVCVAVGRLDTIRATFYKLRTQASVLAAQAATTAATRAPVSPAPVLMTPRLTPVQRSDEPLGPLPGQPDLGRNTW